MTRKIKMRKADAESYKVFFAKSNKFFISAKASLRENNHDAAALACIHSVISGIDSYLTFKTGERSASDNHLDAIFLARQIAFTEDAKTALKHAERVLIEKTSVEYLDVMVSEKKALEMFKHTERFIEWIKSGVPK